MQASSQGLTKWEYQTAVRSSESCEAHLAYTHDCGSSMFCHFPRLSENARYYSKCDLRPGPQFIGIVTPCLTQLCISLCLLCSYTREEVLDEYFADYSKSLVIDDQVMDWIIEALHHSHADEKRGQRRCNYSLARRTRQDSEPP